MENLIEIARSNNGFVSASEVTAAGIQRRELSRAVSCGALIKVERGLYCLPDGWEDEYVIAQHRFARGTFSHDTALYLLGLSDQAPEALTMSFPRGYNVSPAKRAGIITKSSPEGLSELGAASLATPYGNEVRGYDAERSLCDMLRGISSPDAQVFNQSMKAYLSSSERSIPKLQSYAKKLGTAKRINAYLEVLL